MNIEIAELLVAANDGGSVTDMNFAVMSAKRAGVVEVKPFYAAATKGDHAGAKAARASLVESARRVLANG